MEKSILVFLLAIFAVFAASAQENKREFEMKDGDTTYVMKQYVFCLYLSGPTRSQNEEEKAEIQAAHMAHISSMALNHHLQVAGPLGDESEKRGLLIFDLETVEEAEKIITEDPAVKAGRLTFECHPWWAAKGSTLN